MKQKCYEFYCEKRKCKIGDGMCCFTCEQHERPDDWREMKKCKHERVISEYEREV